MRAMCRLVPTLFVLAFLFSCGGEMQERAIIEAHSMEEALALARENDCAIAIEFWIDG